MNNESMQKVWKSLTIKEQRSCIKNNIFTTIEIKKSEVPNIYIISKD
jgi:hypothetical protein